MSKVVNLVSGRERTLLKTSLASSRDAVGVPTSPGKVMRFPPMVMRVRFGLLLFWAAEGGLQVEVANFKRGELGARAQEDAVENELVKFKGCCRGADVAGKGDAISDDSDARAVGIAFRWADLANHFGVSDF